VGISAKTDFGPTIHAPNTLTAWGRYKMLTKATLRSTIIVSIGMITRYWTATKPRYVRKISTNQCKKNLEKCWFMGFL
jgi:hypothetical protein